VITPGHSRATGGARSSLGKYGRNLKDSLEKARDPRHALRRLFNYLSPYRGRLIAVCFIIVIYTVLGLAGPYLMGVAIDRFIAVKRLSGLATIASMMLAAYILENLFHGVSVWMMADVSQRALKGLRRDLFSHMQKLPLSFFDDNPAGELMSRLTNDIDAVNQTVSQNVTLLFASVLSLLGIMIAMFLLNFWLALVSLFIVPLMFLFADFVARYTRRGFRDLQKNLGELNGVIE
jgi:ATP-binding cassette subfamily B protein